jgi:hypothetical protein
MVENMIRGRLARLPGAAVAELVARVAAADVDDCLRLLVISAIDVTDANADAVVREALTQWREQGRVSPTTRSQLAAALTRSDIDAAVAHRSGDIATQRAAFVRARAVHALSIAVDPDVDAAARLAEAAYEAAIAMGGTAGVVAVLVEFVV